MSCLATVQRLKFLNTQNVLYILRVCFKKSFAYQSLAVAQQVKMYSS